MKFISCQKRVFAPGFDTALFVRVTKSLCESPSCPVDLITPPDDCHVNYTLSFSLQVRFYYFYFLSCKEFFLLSLYKILLLDALIGFLISLYKLKPFTKNRVKEQVTLSL